MLANLDLSKYAERLLHKPYSKSLKGTYRLFQKVSDAFLQVSDELLMICLVT